MIASLFQSIKFADPDTNFRDLLRHMALNTYRSLNNKYKNRFGEIVICNDSPNVWRKEYFPNYKQNRKKTDLTGPIQWNEIYDILSSLHEEFQSNLPYKNISVPRCEADDIIAVISRTMAPHSEVMIVSSDKDFQQLQTHRNIYQYSLNSKKEYVCKDPKSFLIEHIIRGDSSDGIPNLFSGDDVFVDENKRQKVCSAKRLARITEQYHSGTSFDNQSETTNWARNKTLIDFDMIPQDINDAILETYQSTIPADRSRLFPYFMSKGLSSLMTDIQDF